MSSREYDNHTPKGRAVIDRAVLRKMGARSWTRGMLANDIGMPERMVSDSLRRLVATQTVERLNMRGEVDSDGRMYRRVRTPQGSHARKAARR